MVAAVQNIFWINENHEGSKYLNRQKHKNRKLSNTCQHKKKSAIKSITGNRSYMGILSKDIMWTRNLEYLPIVHYDDICRNPCFLSQ